jgi:hypothetical protein
VIDGSTRKIEKRIALRVWPRGIATHDGFMFVGESEHRAESRDARAHATVAVVDLASLEVVDRIAVPGREIYDLAVAPMALAVGLTTGFRTNSHRTRTLSQLALFEQVGVEPTRLWAIGEPLPVGDRRARISAEIPAELPPLSSVDLDVELENLGGSIFVSALPNRVFLTYRWYREGSGEHIVEEPVLSPIPHPLPPNTPTRCRIRVRTHDTGRYRLRITLAQEFVGWFDEVEGDNFVEAPVAVGGAQDAVREPLPPEDRRAHVEAEFPDRLPANATVDLGVKLENLGSDVLVTALPNPVYLTYRWYRPGETSHILEDPLMTPLPGIVKPHIPTRCVMQIHTHDPGRYLLRLTLAQQFVGWFDETNDESLVEALVDVQSAV